MNKFKQIKKYLYSNNLDGCIIPKNDIFFNEFTQKEDNQLSIISNFTGSAGLGVILKNKNYLFVDGRYLEQAKKESGKNFIIVNIIKKKLFPLLRNLKICLNPKLFKHSEIIKFQKNNIDIIYDENFLNNITTKKKLPIKQAFLLDEKFSGEDYLIKVNKVRNNLNIKEKQEYFFSSNENICWLLNIRGNDLQYSPILNAHALLTKNKVIVFCELKKISNSIKKFYKPNVQFIEYTKMKSFLKKNITKKISLDQNTISQDMINFFHSNKIKIMFKDDPIHFLKSKKNSVEIANSKIAHILDGSCLVKFMYWLNSTQLNKIDEIKAQNKLENFRKQNKYYLYPSFPSISAFGKNASIIHYNANTNTNLTFKKGLYLIDSGGQYKLGTTDITRTITIGKPKAIIKNIYTKVLQGHLSVVNFNLTKTTQGNAIDIVARKYIKKINLDYPHSTGHGVGYFLNVHESPPSISSKSKNSFFEGQIISNEPGFYKTKKFGIRIENLIFVEKNKNKLRFQDLSMVPYDKNLINKKILNKNEVKYINNYHSKVYENLKNLMNKKELSFLKKICSPI